MRLFCTICQDIYLPCSEVHVTNCGHLYHAACISTWMKQSRTCPQCRTVLTRPFRIYFNVERSEDTDRGTLERRVEVLLDKLREAERCNKSLLDEKRSFEKIAVEMKESTASLTKKNDMLTLTVKSLKEKVVVLDVRRKAVTDLEEEVKSLKSKVSVLERVQTLIEGSSEEVKKMMESTPITELAVKQLCVYVAVLKDQLNKTENDNKRLIKEKINITRALAEEKTISGKHELRESIRRLTDENKKLENENKKLENDLNSLNVSFEEYKKKQSRRFKHLGPPKYPIQERSKMPDFNIEDLFKEALRPAPQPTPQPAPFKYPIQGRSKMPVFNIEDLFDEENISTKVVRPAESDSAIKKWEEFIRNGPPSNAAFSKARSFVTPLCDKDDNENAKYAFDGLGGRKKIRLGGPTPLDEFIRLKQKNCKRSLQHKKVYEYFKVDN